MDAIAALGTMSKDPRAVRMVEKALEDKDRDIRQLAASTLGEMRSKSSIPKLRRALDDDAAEVVFAAARSLWQLGDKSGRTVIEEVFRGERPAGRGTVSENLDRIRKLVTEPKDLVLFGLREAIGSVAGPYAMGMNVVEEFRKDRSFAARVVCANMLAQDRSKESMQLLREGLTDKNWVVRHTAAKAIGAAGDRGAITELKKNLDDDDEKLTVKLMVAASIIKLQRR